jgi:glutaredoxin
MIYDFAEEKEIVIFGTSYCKYCQLAKKLLEDAEHQSWTYVDLEKYPPLLTTKLKAASGQKTIPIIYVKISRFDYEFLGGYDTLAKYFPKKV